MLDMGAHVFRNLPAIRPGKGEVFMADPRLIVVDPTYNSRDMTSADVVEHVEWLANEITDWGFDPDSPLGVKWRDQDVILIRGHCRLAACLKAIERGLELESVPVKPMKGLDDIALIFDQQNSNNGLRLDEFAKGRLCLRARRLGLDDAEIARRMYWKNASDVSRHIKMVEIVPEAVKKQVAQGDISATEAVKLVKSLPAGTDPVEAAKIIEANKQENKRLGVGKKNDHKVTPKTLKRDRPKAEPKPPAEPQVTTAELDASAPLPSGLPAKSEQVGNPVSGAKTYAQLQDEIAGLTAGNSETPPAIVEDDAAAEQRRRDQEFEAAAPKPAPVHSDDLGAWTAARPKNKIEALLFGFVQTDMADLAQQYAQLCREYEEANAQGTASEEQQKLCVHADVTGSLRWPDDWENAKATATDLRQVA